MGVSPGIPGGGEQQKVLQDLWRRWHGLLCKPLCRTSGREVSLRPQAADQITINLGGMSGSLGFTSVNSSVSFHLSNRVSMFKKKPSAPTQK